MSNTAFVLLIVFLAIILDLGFIWISRRALRKRAGNPGERPPGVSLFGAYSPVLTWLKDRSLLDRLIPAGNTIDTQPMPATHQESPAVQIADETLVARSPAAPLTNERSLLVVTSKYNWLAKWIEASILILAVLAYCARILDLNADTYLPGNESDLFQAYDWVLFNSLKIYHEFPLWNPYFFTGLPFVADPMMHTYNPVVTIPVLLFGVRSGFKLAIVFSYLLGAFGMRYVGSVMGFKRPVRVWMALMFVFAGQPTARFFQGEYLFILGFAWIPWIIACLIMAVRTHRRVYVGATALFLAVMFFCGNAYYQLYMVIIAGLFALTMILQFDPARHLPHFDRPLAGTLLTIGLLSLALISIQLLPLAELWPRMSKDMNVAGDHTFRQIFLDFTSKDNRRPDAFNDLPAPEEFYAYIGITPFLFLLLLPLALQRRYGDHQVFPSSRRLILFFCMVLLFSILWINLKFLPGGDWLLKFPLIIQFRHLLRVLLFGGLALIILAAFGLDAAWRRVQDWVAISPANSPNSNQVIYIGRVLLIALLIIMAVGAGDVFYTNNSIIETQEIYKPAYQIIEWVRTHDLSNYYIRPAATNSWRDAIFSNNLRFIDLWYPFDDIRIIDKGINKRQVKAEPRYYIETVKGGEPRGISPPSLVAEIEGYRVYEFSQSLPFSFSVTKAILDQETDSPIQRTDVSPLTAFVPGPNSVEVLSDAPPDSNSMLVVLVTHYPGWRVYVDGRPAELKSVSGYLGVDLVPGTHKYTFAYRPFWFYLGLWISLAALALTLYLIVSDTRLRKQDFVAAWQSLRSLPERLGRRKASVPRVAPAWAVYRHESLQLEQGLSLPEETRVYVTVDAGAGSASPARLAARLWWWATVDLTATLTRSLSLDAVLFAGSLALYLYTRLVGLTQFPIYFFTDEAVQTLLASDLLRDGLRGLGGEFLPTYFQNVYMFNLSTSVYVQALPYLLFGKSAFVTRAVPALLSLLAAFWAGLILRDGFQRPYWWSGTLLLAAVPAWFLHSRTAFETSLAVTFFTGALYYYLRYRNGSLSSLYPSLILFALTFYSYSPAQVVVAITGLLLLITDLRYHLQNREVALRGALLLVLLGLPYLRFRINHPIAVDEHLERLGSYWIYPLAWYEKVLRFISTYLHGLSPVYWFLPNHQDLDRHLMKGYGNVHWSMLPLVILGLIITLRKLRTPAYRILLIALLAAPVGAAIVQIAITRALIAVVPLALLAGLGLTAILSWLERFRLSPRIVAAGAFIVLVFANLAMTRDALVNGPTWYQDYGMHGMQYGATQLFASVKSYMQAHPEEDVVISANWANGADLLGRFFLPEEKPVQFASIDDYKNQRHDLENKVFVLTPDEYDQAVSDALFKSTEVIQTLPYPNGKPGFYFLRLEYSDDFDEQLAVEKAAARELTEDQVTVGGQEVLVRHSLLDMGNILELLDANPDTLARTATVNPFILEFEFSQPRQIAGISLIIGSTQVDVSALLTPADGSAPVKQEAVLNGSIADPEVTLEFNQPVLANKLRLEITDLSQGEIGHVHLWEIQFLTDLIQGNNP